MQAIYFNFFRKNPLFSTVSAVFFKNFAEAA